MSTYNVQFKLRIDHSPCDVGWSAFVVDFPCIRGIGRTQQEASEDLIEIIRALLEWFDWENAQA